MNKTIEIKKTTIRNFILSFIIGFSVLFVLEHFGKFSYTVNTPREYDSSGRLMAYSYVKGDTKVDRIYYDTYFGNKIESSGNNFTVADINYADTDFDKYSVQSYYYTKASITDSKYGIYISLILFIIALFFSIFKIKFS